MRLLLLTQVVPYPPDSGPRIKTHNVLRYLAGRHEVHLISFVRSPDETADLHTLGGLCASVTPVPLRRSRLADVGYLARSLVTGRPFLIERDASPGLERAVADLLARLPFDAVLADQLSMAQFAVDLPLRLRVLDQHNAVWTIVRRAAGREQGVRRVLAELEWRKLRAYELAICRRFDRVCVVSEQDRIALTGPAGPPATATIPIAVDPEALAFQPRGPGARQILSVATMFYPPNVEGVAWFAEQVLPLVRRAIPDTRFTVVGSRPPARITALATPESGVAVTGYVADLEPILRESALLVVPLHSGSGMRVKILEAFARGLPVVSTTIGAEGIDVRHGEHLLIADDPRDFARAVVRLLDDPREAARLAAAGRRLVEARYDWRRALSGLDAVFPTVTAPAPAGSELPAGSAR